MPPPSREWELVSRLLMSRDTLANPIMHAGGMLQVGLYNLPANTRGLAGRTGISAGRLVYVGFRYVYFNGSTQRRSDDHGSYDVTTRAQLIAADVGVQYPAGAVDLVAGVTIGAARYHQESISLETAPSEFGSAIVGTEFLIAPNFSVQFRVLHLLVIPEVMYHLAG